MLDTRSFSHNTRASERSFAYVFSAVFLVLALWPLLFDGEIRIWALAISVAVLGVGLLRPAWLKGPNRLWLSIGVALGTIVSPVVMAALYTLVILPTGLLLRLLGKRPAPWRDDESATTYWVERREQPGSMRRQF